jgi:GR25 family glycosyltransferase involved in LPS biosynthesis
MIDINDFFDKIYYINLRGRKDRNENVLRNFNELGITNFKRIEAIQPEQIENDDIPLVEIKRHKTNNKRKKVYRKFRYNKNIRGCLLSHYECVKDMKKNGYQRVIVFEDDFELENEDYANALNVCMEFMENNKWDLFYLDNKKSLVRSGNEVEFFDCVKQGNEDIIRVNKLIAHSYCINKSCVDFLYDNVLGYGGHIDGFYRKHSRKRLKSYFFQDGIFKQGSFSSNLKDSKKLIDKKTVIE